MAELWDVLGAEGASAESVTLPMVRYRITFEVTEPVQLPEYSGSTLRGAFGTALRLTACMTRQKDCKTCPLYRSCPYTEIFETPPPEKHALQKFSQIPNAYVIEPPNWGRRAYERGEKLEFHFVLFGRALRHLALVVYAMQRAFAHDVGHGRAIFRGLAVESGGDMRPLIHSMDERIPEHEETTTVRLPAGGNLTLNVETPLRLQKNGTPLQPHEIGAHALLMAMMRRIALIYEFQCREPLALDFRALSEAAEDVQIKTDLVWKDWTRYSNRQQKRMNLGGVVGWIELMALPRPFAALCACSTLTHIGKNATFGLGRVSLANDGQRRELD